MRFETHPIAGAPSSSTEPERLCLFPLHLVFGGDAEVWRWRRGFAQHGAVEDTEPRGQLMDRFETEVLKAFDGYVVPTIMLGQETTRWSVRVHGGPDGRGLSDRLRVPDHDARRR